MKLEARCLQAPRAYSDATLLDVHRAMLRLAAARGDMLALLSMPLHYREDEALAHAAALRSPVGRSDRVAPLSAGENAALSFGALYHPWLAGREENELSEIRMTPPDGAMCGVLAARTLDRGAWIAAANEALRGVVALDPPIARPARQAFFEAQVNLIRQEPEGFLCLAADTMSVDTDYRPISVRRLLSLLRRLALKKGAEYVFEPNSEEFRRLVKRGLESVLESLFRDGAFAGNTPSRSFQVLTDETVTPPRLAEEGKFVAEIRVAPSLPMSFLTIRLSQTADRAFVTEGS